MKQSQLFAKTKKEAPKDEVSKNAILLSRGGFIHKEMAGVYSFLPFGLKVLDKIIAIIKEEMEAIGGQELLMSSLQDADLWKVTDRWDASKVDAWFRTKLKNETEVGLGFTHEEPTTRMMKEHIQSYKDLPKYIYQVQTKFRNEERARSGVIRTREFLMKDLYSFCKDEKEHYLFYEKIKKAYLKIFSRVGLGKHTYITFASGGVFAKYSHEFQTISEAGEDTIFVDAKKKVAINKEVLSDEVMKDLGVKKEELVEKRAIEVGNIFSLGTRFSDALGLKYVDEKGESKSVVMGSYGIGPARLMGTVVEIYSDEKGIIWPESVAPFQVHLIQIENNPKVKKAAEKLYQDLSRKKLEVLFDDRQDKTAGEKFADADLIGIPYRIVVSEKTLKKECVETKRREEEKIELVKIKSLPQFLKSKIKNKK